LLTDRYHQGKNVDLLFGLDMLKAHQACIDLEKNVLRIQGREVEFLPEHELPDKARIADAGGSPDGSGNPAGTSPGESSHAGGNTLGSAPNRAPTTGPSITSSARQQTENSSRHPESAIQSLIDLGVTREIAIRTLDVAGGNLDHAVSLLFNF
jgi:DNA damage-inducible protein 1